MTVAELHKELSLLIQQGHADTRVIANCSFTINKGNGFYDGYPLCHLNDVYYQSGDIELGFSDKEEENNADISTEKRLV